MSGQTHITDVTLRDGLQMESGIIDTPSKLTLFEKLSRCGYDRLEMTSFSHPKSVPALADSDAFCEAVFSKGSSSTELMAFVPNKKGLERCLRFNIPWVSVFIAVSETFNRRNINQSTKETLAEIEDLVGAIHSEKRKVRVYLSTAFGCPYEGAIPKERLLSLFNELSRLRPDEIALSDTIGVGLPHEVGDVLRDLSRVYPLENTALHVHNTYGLGLASVAAAFDVGVRKFDGSTGGLGGCPYAKGASGNLATEDLLYFFSRSGYGRLQLFAVREALVYISAELKLKLQSRLGEVISREGNPYGIV